MANERAELWEKKYEKIELRAQAWQKTDTL